MFLTPGPPAVQVGTCCLFKDKNKENRLGLVCVIAIICGSDDVMMWYYADVNEHHKKFCDMKEYFWFIA